MRINDPKKAGATMRLSKFGLAAIIIILLAILARFTRPRASTLAQTTDTHAAAFPASQP